MTLPALEKHVQKAHTPMAETILVEFVYDIKQWIEPYLNSIKNHVYPHSYTFFKKNGKVEMKYKAWANDKTWLPEGTGFHLLNGVPEGTPSLVRPEFRKQLGIKELTDSVNKCKRMNKEDRQWWNLFIQNEKRYRQKWEAASEDLLNNHKKQWPLLKLKKHLTTKVAKRQDPDQEALEQNLEDLLRKADHCPNVSFLVLKFTVTRQGSQAFTFLKPSGYFFFSTPLRAR